MPQWNLIYALGFDDEGELLGGYCVGEYPTYAEVLRAYHIEKVRVATVYGPGELIVTNPAHERLPTPEPLYALN